MDTNRTPYALGSEDGEALWFFGILVTMKATSEQTGGEFLLIEELAPRGTATPLHVHPTYDESFYILEGEMTFYIEDGQPYRPPQARSCTSLKGTSLMPIRWTQRRRGFFSSPGPLTNTLSALLLSQRCREPSLRQNRPIWRRLGPQRQRTGSRY